MTDTSDWLLTGLTVAAVIIVFCLLRIESKLDIVTRQLEAVLKVIRPER